MQLGQGNWFYRLAVPTVRCATVPTWAAAGVAWAFGASLAAADHDAVTTPMLRAVWIDDLPAEALPSPSPFANGQVSLFPGKWASLGVQECGNRTFGFDSLAVAKSMERWVT